MEIAEDSIMEVSTMGGFNNVENSIMEIATIEVASRDHTTLLHILPYSLAKIMMKTRSINESINKGRKE